MAIRPYSPKLISLPRVAVPGICLRTSLIAGFPQETEKEFGELLSFVKEARFERLGVFVYSREEKTPAYNFSGQVPLKEKLKRFDMIMSLQQKIAGSVNARFLGKSIPVLIEEKRDGVYLGRSEYDAPEVDGIVYVKTRKELKAGEFVKAKITDTLEYDLVGEVKS